MTFKVQFTMRQLLEAGAHYGHRKNFWNPKMGRYIYGTRNGIHIIDLQQTVPMLSEALDVLKAVAVKNGRILFVGTKKTANEIIAEQALRCGQYFVNHRWLGGMLTNWSTVSASIKTLKGYEEALNNEASVLNKKEKLDLDRKRLKLENFLGGIRNMGGRPDVIFVIDTNQEEIAIAEAKKLGIPVIAIVDTNSNPDSIDYPIPGNDDARRSIELFCSLAADAILSGMQESMSAAGVDIKTVDAQHQDAANTELPDVDENKNAQGKKPAPGKDKKEAPKKKVAEVITKKAKSAAPKAKIAK
ncbi:MAG: 30S ribosomal protein S2 [Rickettsiales bacterium]